MNDSGSSKSADSPPGQRSSFSLVRVLGITLGLVIVGGAIFGVVEYLNNQKPTLAKVTGRVTWNGKPVTIGAVMTEHTGNRLYCSIGALDSDGKFELLSNGAVGAVVGTHKVMIASYGEGVVPPPLVPQQYLKANTTPLEIKVSNNPDQNYFELEVVGDPPGSGRQRDAEDEAEARPAEESSLESTSDPGESPSDSTSSAADAQPESGN